MKRSEKNVTLNENSILGITETVLENPPESTLVRDVSDDYRSEIVLPSTSSASAVTCSRKGNRGSSCRARHV